jgi:hypothetical protein
MFKPRGPERRETPDRREGADRRSANPPKLTLVPVERRSGVDRRQTDRRTTPDRRRYESAEQHIKNALQLLGNLAGAGVLDDEMQRDLDSAMFRLRFAVDRLEQRLEQPSRQ